MTLPELLMVFGSIAGAIVGQRVGVEQFGWLGGAIGLLLGMVAGSLAGGLSFELYAKASIAYERSVERWFLRRHFGRYWKTHRTEQWDEVDNNFATDDWVTGTVVAKFRYGIFLDIGCTFPALLPRNSWGGGTIKADPGIGAQVRAMFERTNEYSRYLRLTQRQRHPGALTAARAEAFQSSRHADHQLVAKVGEMYKTVQTKDAKHNYLGIVVSTSSPAAVEVMQHRMEDKESCLDERLIIAAVQEGIDEGVRESGVTLFATTIEYVPSDRADYPAYTQMAKAIILAAVDDMTNAV